MAANNVYLVWGDDYFDSYGSNVVVFGIFETYKQAEEVRNSIIDYYYTRHEGKYSRSLIDENFRIDIIPLFEKTIIELGGYQE